MFFLGLCVTCLANVAYCIGNISYRANIIPSSNGQDWLNTTRPLSRSCSASFSETPVWGRWLGNAVLSVKQPRNEALSRFSYLPNSAIPAN